MKKTSMPNPANTLDISSATARVAADLLKALVILPDTNVRRSAVNLKFFKDFTNHRKKTNRVVVFTCRTFPTF